MGDLGLGVPIGFFVSVVSGGGEWCCGRLRGGFFNQNEAASGRKGIENCVDEREPLGGCDELKGKIQNSDVAGGYADLGIKVLVGQSDLKRVLGCLHAGFVEHLGTGVETHEFYIRSLEGFGEQPNGGASGTSQVHNGRVGRQIVPNDGGDEHLKVPIKRNTSVGHVVKDLGHFCIESKGARSVFEYPIPFLKVEEGVHRLWRGQGRGRLSGFVL